MRTILCLFTACVVMGFAPMAFAQVDPASSYVWIDGNPIAVSSENISITAVGDTMIVINGYVAIQRQSHPAVKLYDNTPKGNASRAAYVAMETALLDGKSDGEVAEAGAEILRQYAHVASAEPSALGSAIIVYYVGDPIREEYEIPKLEASTPDLSGMANAYQQLIREGRTLLFADNGQVVQVIVPKQRAGLLEELRAVQTGSDRGGNRPGQILDPSIAEAIRQPSALRVWEE